ncbi:pleckstrin homology domain-containing family G member 1 [Trichonephila clavipes]|nr:pleckstrin homology domain-containing family G member 1 [Trichonephila clavipes]
MPQTLDHLEDNIRRVIADIRPQMLEKVIENWTSRLDYIRASCGSHMPEIGYLKHISNAEEAQVSHKYLKDLFSNIEDIYTFNRLFVDELEACGLDPVAVARCFVKNSNGFEVYTQYCTNYPRTVSVLTELMGNSETAEIFKNMVKHANKESDGYCDVKNALSVMTGIAYHINDMKRKHEHAVRVQEIQSLLYGWEGQDLTTYGELVAEGAFRMYRAKALRHLFLFDKMLLIAKKKEEGILSYKTHIMCSNLMLIESIQGEPLCFHVIPFDNPRFQYTFQARNVEQKREWCLQLKRVILENYNAVIPSHARQLVMELGQSKQEDSALEKSTTKRQLSAPEYLEKRKQERRKSELNLNRTLKLKKVLKKVGPVLTQNHSNSRHKNGNSHENWKDNDKSSWTKSQEDVCHKKRWLLGHLGNKENLSDCSSSANSSIPFNRSTRARHSLPEPSLSQRNVSKERRFRPSWRTWNSVPEETTDTENEDADSKRYGEYGSSLSYRDRTYSEASEEAFDNNGEYVTFFYAHAYATRDMHNGNAELPRNEADVENVCSDMEDKVAENRESRSKLGSKNATEEPVNSKPERQKDQDSESGSSVSSWKQSSAIRRVQSFTGMAKARVASLQHNISFKYHSSSNNEPKSKSKKSSLPPNGICMLPSDLKETSPTTPAAWLKQQEEHLAESGKKSGSLPRSFQLGSENVPGASERKSAVLTENNVCRMRLRMDGQRSLHSEQRPFTIASDKPSHADFGDDLDYVVLDYSHCTNSEYGFSICRDGYEQDTTTGCTNTPAVSMENVHSIHPELKIYHQSASKYATLKHIFSHMGSKIAGFKATLVSPNSHDHSNQENHSRSHSEPSKNDFKRSGSHSSIKSENEINSKLFPAKIAHSVAKAYSSVMRHKKKHELKIGDKKSGLKKEKISIGSYKSESSLIGARMAQPLESEYSVPKLILPAKIFKDLRPDSLFSESSNATSSSDGDKNCMNDGSEYPKIDADDTVSEASDTSADSYYERTFDAIENALAHDIFRDSAIYSDPEDADFSAVENPNIVIGLDESNLNQHVNNSVCYQNGDTDSLSPSSPKIMCARRVNQAILDRLRILEENVKFQNEEASAIITKTKTHQKRLDLDKWGTLVLSKDFEESETSSEHSASTVNTVMESGHKVSKSNGSVNCRSPPRVKGWVKHVVEKLQGEGQV